MTTVVMAPDAFKGTVSAADAARALGAGWLQERPSDTVILCPMADGGEGTLEAFATRIPGAQHYGLAVTGPAGRDIQTSWLHLPATDQFPGGTGVVELASTSGIMLLDQLLPETSGTTGLGQAMVAALDHGVSQLIVGIGSSASTDGGLGMLVALGARAMDRHGNDVAAGLRGLRTLDALDMSALRPLPAGGVRVITDVTNPLTGKHGAAHTFGRQKGLTLDQATAADQALRHVATLIPWGQAHAPGAGAAGGTGFTLRAWGAELAPGASEVANLLDLPCTLRKADVVVTGEGQFDEQSARGKVPGYVADLARSCHCDAFLVAGRITFDGRRNSFAQPVALDTLAGSVAAACTQPERWLRIAGRRLAAQ